MAAIDIFKLSTGQRFVIRRSGGGEIMLTPSPRESQYRKARSMRIVRSSVDLGLQSNVDMSVMPPNYKRRFSGDIIFDQLGQPTVTTGDVVFLRDRSGTVRRFYVVSVQMVP